jgi:hypothetical protein
MDHNFDVGFVVPTSEMKGEKRITESGLGRLRKEAWTSRALSTALAGSWLETEAAEGHADLEIVSAAPC